MNDLPIKNQNIFSLNQWIFLLIFGLLTIGVFLYGLPIEQKNPDSIFLTEESRQEFEKFKSLYGEQHQLIVLDNEFREFEKSGIETLCVDDCELINETTLKKKITIRSDIDPSRLSFLSIGNKKIPSTLFLSQSEHILKKIMTHIEILNGKIQLPGDKIRLAGIPYTNFLLDQYSASIQSSLFPLMFVLGFILTIFSLQNVYHAFFVYFPNLFMAVLSLSVLRLFLGSMNMVTSMVPLVVFTISLTLSFHLYYSLREFKSVKFLLKNKWVPIFLMMFTTYIGFLSLAFSPIEAIKDFGIFSSQIILFATVFLFFWMKVFENIFIGDVNRIKFLQFINQKFQSISKNMFARTLSQTWILFLMVIGIGALIYFPRNIPVITDATRYFPLKSHLREDIMFATQNSHGMPIIEALIDFEHIFSEDNHHEWKSNIDSQINREFDVQKVLNEKFPQFHFQVLSNLQLVREMNYLYAGDTNLPENPTAFFALKSMLPLALSEGFPMINPSEISDIKKLPLTEQQRYRLVVLGSPLNVDEYNQIVNVFEDYFRKENIPTKFHGLHHHLMVSQESMIKILIESFLSSALCVLLCSIIYFRSFKQTMYFMYVSMLPICLIFPFMYSQNYTFNVATVMTFSVALGLLGDSSFHLIHTFRKTPFKTFDDYQQAVLTPIFISTISLSLCFYSFLGNSFIPIKEFGGILGTAILLGGIADLYLLPTLLYGSTDHRNAYQKKVDLKFSNDSSTEKSSSS